MLFTLTKYYYLVQNKVNGMFQIIFVSWILVLPFIVFGNIYEGAKVFIFWVGSFALILYWIACRKMFYKLKEITGVLNKWDIWYWVWIGVLIISSFNGLDPTKSLIGGGYRHQGVLFFVSLWVVGKSVLLLDEKYKRILSNGFIITVVAQVLIIVLQKVLNISPTNFRPIGTLGEPNAVAGFINIGLFFSQNIYFTLLIFVANLILQSRTGIIMFLILVVPLLFRRKLFLLLPYVIIAVSFLFYFSNIRNIQGPYNFESRTKYVKVATLAILEKPILGYGLESIDEVFDQGYKNMGINLEGLMIDRSHNFILDILLWSGILGLIPFSVWLIGNLRDIYKFEVHKLRNYKKFVAVIAILIFGLLQPIWLVHWILLFVILNL